MFIANSTPITELKTRARLLLNALQANDAASVERSTRISKKHGWPIPETWTLRHALNLAAGEAGFSHWEQARQIFSGAAQAGDDMGEFWYDKQAHGFINHWFASYPEAREQLKLQPENYLLPYKNQFFIAEHPCVAQLGLASTAAYWEELGHDLVAAYGKPAWLTMCMARLNATRQSERPTSAKTSEENKRQDDDFARRVLHSFVENGRINKIPQMRKKRLVILQWLVNQLEKEKRYPEREINTFLLQFHEDYATLRREFIACKLMQRQDEVYWRC